MPFQALKACNYRPKIILKQKGSGKIGLKTCNEIPLFSFPQIALSTADISDAIQNSQLNCNFSCKEQPKPRLCMGRMAV